MDGSYAMTCRTMLVTAAVLCLAVASAQATVIEDFDGGGTTPYALTGIAVVEPGGGTGNAVKLTRLRGGAGTIAFDHEAVPGDRLTQISLSFDFSMTDDATNAASGGCCGYAADGLGIGLFSTAAYGTSGASTPGGAGWERPHFADAFAIGLDIFPGGSVGNAVSINWGGAEIAAIDPGFQLNASNTDVAIYHSATVTVNTDNMGNAYVDMTIIEDVNGAAVSHLIFDDVLVAGMDLQGLFDYRIIAGGRTGGAWNDGYFDNIGLTEVAPEPATLGLLGLGALALLRRRRGR